MRFEVSRRAFLLGSAIALGALALPRRLPIGAGASFACAGEALRASLSPLCGAALPIGHHFNPDADELAQHAARFDALLLPAYAAAELIARDALRSIAGTPGRAHDPEGAFTVPHTVVHFPLTEDLFSPRAVWPRYGRLAIALALLRRGYPVNDQHPGHINQAAVDLVHAQPLFVRNPLAALGAASPSVTGVPAITLEYDWVIPRASANPTAAESFIRAQSSILSHQSSFLTLTPLSAKARTLYAEAWRTILQYSNSR